MSEEINEFAKQFAMRIPASWISKTELSPEGVVKGILKQVLPLGFTIERMTEAEDVNDAFQKVLSPPMEEQLKQARISAIKECAEIAEKAVDAHKKGYEETTQPASLKNQFRTKQFAVDTVLQEILSLIEAEEGK